MAKTVMVVLSCLVATCMVNIIVAPYAEAAMGCEVVMSTLRPCIGYLTSGGVVPATCCDGIRNLILTAETTADRQIRQNICNCLKDALQSISGIDLNRAGGLPGICGVSIPYKISPNTDCLSVN